jgi:hypothetical protein
MARESSGASERSVGCPKPVGQLAHHPPREMRNFIHGEAKLTHVDRGDLARRLSLGGDGARLLVK